MADLDDALVEATEQAMNELIEGFQAQLAAAMDGLVEAYLEEVPDDEGDEIYGSYRDHARTTLLEGYEYMVLPERVTFERHDVVKVPSFAEWVKSRVIFEVEE